MKFAHIADTHIRNLKYHYEYKQVFQRLYETLKEEKPDYIVHCGDIAHTKTQISPEFVEMCSEFLVNLANIAPTYVILGNHDGNLKNSNRQDALTPIANALDHKDLYLLKNSGETILDGGYALNVLSVFDEDNWAEPSNYDNINIALYHGSISGCSTDANWTMEHGENDISIFDNFDYAFLGDIHKTNQSLDKRGKIRYCGSTVQQNHGETNDKGFLIWDISDKDTFTCKHFVLENPKPFVTIELTPKGRMPKNVQVNPGARLRIVSNNNLPLDRLRRAMDVARTRFKPESVTFLNRASGERGSIEELTDSLQQEDLRDLAVQEELIGEYLKDYHLSDEVLDRVCDLNKRYNAQAEANEDIARNVNWRLKKLEFDNLFNYGENNSIDFDKLNGIVGVFGKNFSGKSSIIDSFLYTLFNSTSKNVRKNVNIINQTKDIGLGRVHIEIGQDTYVVERESEKYVKKLRGQETVEAKTNVDFSKVDCVTEEEVSLNGLTRAETDKNIRKVFGSMDDFLLTAMASQLGSLTFISEGSTKRKEILAKFLDLEVFDKKFKLAKDDASDLRGALKLLEGRNFEEEIEIAETNLHKNEIATVSHKRRCEKLNIDLEKAESKLEEVDGLIATASAHSINIESEMDRRSKLEAKLASLEQKNEMSNAGIEKNNVFIEKAKDFLRTFDIEKLEEKREIYSKKSEELGSLTRDIERQEREQEILCNRAKTLEGVPCGSNYLTSCKFIKDAHAASAQVSGVSDQLVQLTEARAGLESEILSLDIDTAKEHIKKYKKLLDKKTTTETENVKLKLDIERNNNSATSLRSSLSECEERIAYYHDNQDAIENLRGLKSDKAGLESEISTINTSIESCEESLLGLYKSHGSLEREVEILKSQESDLQELRSKYEAYDLYMKCMHSNGIAYDIIKKRLPIINNEIAKVMANIVDFEVFLEDDGKKLDILIKHPKYEARPLELGSGAEKTISSMAIRMALLSVSSLPKGNIFILDEPGTALDEDNMEGFVRLLDIIKTYFKTVLLISHLDSLKDCVDSQVSIERNGKFAFVNH
tara:strand:- start:295 stop:3450 length:3156 start_codon:yes stop_codon:yes gene_type:complete